MSDTLGVEEIMATSLLPPAGHYSHAIRANGFVFVSGQLPIGLDSTPQPDASFEDQVRLVIRNLGEILAAAGTDTSNLVRVTAYIVGIENWPRFNATYAALLAHARPARTVVPVAELHHGCLVEIDAVALSGGKD